ncbi:MAG: ATP-binding cassette domain-containing protein [Clostridia bacterium]|nr:ATP-binding cassette domain-containing protein [Clostridia bacterium]
MSTPMIEVKHLKKYFNTPKGTLHAVDDISFKIEKGKTMGVVGESGCGKSTLGRTIIHLLESTDGQIFLDGRDITHVDKKQMHEINERMQIVFQDPYSSLNPRQTVEDVIREPLKLSKRYKTREEIDRKTDELMNLVGIDERLRHAYPHELDGGRRQRVGIARALSLNPDFIVCDEPVSALDVSIQAQVLNLLQDLQEKQGLTYMFVTHDLSVVRHISDDICVMYLGQLVETSPAKELFIHPLHPYTKALLSAIPSTDIDHPHERIKLQGEITSPIDPKPGCRFAARCPYATEACHQPQQLEEILPNHYIACCRARELNKDIL